MLIIIISWIAISIVLLSFGDIFLWGYNRIAKSSEEYNFPDTFLLGLCFVSITLPITSFWWPSNHYILLLYMAISIIYWALRRQRLLNCIGKMRAGLKSLSNLQKGSLAVLIAGVMLFVLFVHPFYDAAFYHYQLMRWNEEYSIVPGLANLEDRFGFNFNYLLVSAIFSFRFLSGEAIYSLNPLLFTIISCWCFISIVKKDYDIRYILLFVLLLCIFIMFWDYLPDSNTDIIPILCIFYYIVKTVLKPGWYKQQLLLSCLLPVVLATFKLSAAIFCLASLGVIIYCFAQNRKRNLAFLIATSVLVVALWCIRNIIISGYLVYPLHSIDLFGFDWKVPKGIALLQVEHIYHWAKYNFIVAYFLRQITPADKIGSMISIISYVSTLYFLITPFVVSWWAIKKRKINMSLYWIYIVSCLSLITGTINAPDFRFNLGYILGCGFLVTVLILGNKRGILRINKVLTYSVLIIFILLMLQKTVLNFTEYKDEITTDILFKQWRPKHNTDFVEYKLEGGTVYLTKHDGIEAHDVIPATCVGGVPFNPFIGCKAQDIRTIESRGTTFQDGFRTKQQYIDTINANAQKYFEDYYYQRYISDRYK
ncbi:hypothetical protein [Dysgonomonas sp. 511]|uniref:LIC_10190 family membrane protein n=1 Tax=Dysgonomonas sp. 511 TaxID=2302930 RepID=UPI0013D3BF94|nr:hypothetical protein [Dysgonomonas sp. 511]NDV79247.1 hypothetical protein [Dysgonomonas sp. 511]